MWEYCASICERNFWYIATVLLNANDLWQLICDEPHRTSQKTTFANRVICPLFSRTNGLLFLWRNDHATIVYHTVGVGRPHIDFGFCRMEVRFLQLQHMRNTTGAIACVDVEYHSTTTPRPIRCELRTRQTPDDRVAARDIAPAHLRVRQCMPESRRIAVVVQPHEDDSRSFRSAVLKRDRPAIRSPMDSGPPEVLLALWKICIATREVLVPRR